MIRAHRHIFSGGCAFLALVAFSALSGVRAQSFPSNVIRVVVPTGPGGPPDVISRVIATELSENQGWRVVIENRPGGAQTTGMADVLNHAADGYSMYSMTVPSMAVPALFPNLGLRPDIDFAPVVKISVSYNVLVVTPSLPVQSISELITVLKSHPGKFNFASGGFGTPAHLIGEMFKLQTGVRATHIPYQQAQQRMVDLLNGTTQFDFLATVRAHEFIATGKLRALAVTAPNRVAALKDVPTIVEEGFPGLVVEDYVGFAVKRGTPNQIIARLNEAINKALEKQKVRDSFANVGAVPVGGTQADFGDLIRSEVVRWGSVVRESGIKM